MDPTEVSTHHLVARLKEERDLLLGAVVGLGKGADTIAVTEPGGWTARDVIAHLIHYTGQIAFALGAPERPPAYVVAETERLTGQQWNERAVAFWRPSDTGAVVAEFTRVTDVLIEFAAKKSDDELRAPHGLPWAAPGPLWEFIGHDTFLSEWPVHRAQIKAAARSAPR